MSVKTKDKNVVVFFFPKLEGTKQNGGSLVLVHRWYFRLWGTYVGLYEKIVDVYVIAKVIRYFILIRCFLFRDCQIFF